MKAKGQRRKVHIRDHSLTLSSDKYLISTYYELGTALGAGDAVDGRETGAWPHGAYRRAREEGHYTKRHQGNSVGSCERKEHSDVGENNGARSHASCL